METKASDILRDARKRIETPEKWTQGAYCRDESREECGIGGTATSWCSSGAILQASDVEGGGFYEKAAHYLRQMTGAIVTWNDYHSRTHADVLQAFDKAIALAESEGQ